MSRTVADALNQFNKDHVETKAPKVSPNFTGVPTAPTADNDTDSTQIATTEFCQNLIRRLVGSAPETLNTLVELATAINNDPNFAQAIVQALDGKLNKTDAANTYATKTELENASTDGITKYNNGTLFYGQKNGNYGMSVTSSEKIQLTGASDFDTGIKVNGHTTFMEAVRFKEEIEFYNSSTCVGKLTPTTKGFILENEFGEKIVWNGNGYLRLSAKNLNDNNETIVYIDGDKKKVEITASGGLWVNGTRIAS